MAINLNKELVVGRFEKTLQRSFGASTITSSTKLTCYRINRLFLVVSRKFVNQACEIVLLICLKM